MHGSGIGKRPDAGIACAPAGKESSVAPSKPPPVASPAASPFGASVLLAAAAVAVYFGVWHFDFVNFDDPLYVTANRHVQTGMSIETVRWAFTDATAVTNYFAPLTWISFLVDFELHGMKAGGYHLTNLLLHIGNTLLLFYLLRVATGAHWKSLFVAALFCVHPLHVESVAWVTERKDVLSTFFLFLTVLFYARYAMRPGVLLYLPVAGSLMLGLMAKPMLVTLPFALLLLDWWPLRRIERLADGRTALRLAAEKIPLLLIVAAASAAAFATQDAGGAVKSLATYPIGVRAANVALGYVWYLYKTVWPTGLAVVYPYPAAPSFPAAAAAATLLAAATFGALHQGRRCPYLPVGWLWYLGTLVPVIGWVVIGDYTVADRYSYVSLVGIFIMVAWGVPDLLGGKPWKKVLLPAAGLASIAVLSFSAHLQVRHWKDSMTLFGRTLAVTEDNYQAHGNYGRALSDQGRLQEAARHYRSALEIQPGDLLSRMNLAAVQARTGDAGAAMENFGRILAVEPDHAPTLYNMARLLVDQGRTAPAEAALENALRSDPGHADAHRLLSVLLIRRGDMEAAEFHLRRALEAAPNDAEIQIAAGDLLLARGKIQEGRTLLARALEQTLSGNSPPGPAARQAVIRLAEALAAQHRTEAARNLLQRALRTDPDNPDFRHRLQGLGGKGP